MVASAAATSKSELLYRLAYLAAAALLFVVAVWQLLSPLRLNAPGADIWQHLAALTSIIEQPGNPSNPFVASEHPSRLFGPYWIVVGSVAKVLGANALQAFVAAGVLNVLLWLVAIFLFGRTFFGSDRGPLFLLGSVTLGWIWPPTFTGYYAPISIIAGAAYPAFLLLALTLLLWWLTLRLLAGGTGFVSIMLLGAFMAATHPFAAAVGFAGSAAFAMFHPTIPYRRKLLVGAGLAVGALLALMWPWYSVAAMIGSASSESWTTSAHFYSGAWLAQSLLPAIIGLFGLFNRRLLPLLALLAACVAGFALGTSEAFAAGHRLLPYIVLIMHIGLAGLLLRGWTMSRFRVVIAAVAAVLVMVQSQWTASMVAKVRQETISEGTLLRAARNLAATIPPSSGIAGDSFASLPIAATGQLVLSTPFAEPLVPDYAARQADSQALFDPTVGRAARDQIATRRSIDYLIVDVRTVSPEALRMLRSEAVAARRAGNLIMFQVERNAGGRSRASAPTAE